MQRRQPILIAGGGIGGLSLALALARRGIACTVLEGRPVFSEAGAGIQIGPNGVRVLRDVGIAERLSPLAGVPRAIHVHNGVSGNRLAELPLGDWIESRHGAPYWTVHRADLHAALLAAAGACDSIEIVSGFAVAGLESTVAGVSVVAEDGRTREGAALVGADGIWSAVRKLLHASPPLVFSGKTATRTVLPADTAERRLLARAAGVWLAPGAHVVHYPVRGGTEIAIVAILDEDWSGMNWNTPADRGFLMRRVAPLAPGLRDMLASAAGWHKWALFDPPPLPAWSAGRVTLLGDAAHPILPFLAQGGVMALEDATVAAAELAVSADDPAAAFQRYERVRRPRTVRVQGASRRNGQIYHLAGATAIARNLMLSTAPGTTVVAGYDWLYGWRSGHGTA